MSEVLLSAQNLTVRFGGVLAVNDVSFDVRRGEVFTLGKGSFGSGKAGLSDGAQSTAKTVAAYVQAYSSASGVRVEVTAADAKLAQRRADAVHDALVAGGVAQGKVQATGRAGKGERAEVVVQSK